jgi:hypothetical protein
MSPMRVVLVAGYDMYTHALQVRFDLKNDAARGVGTHDRQISQDQIL